MTKNIGVFVAWPYANGNLHLGHIAGAYLPADIFARYHRLKGNNVLMVSGSDSHGTPITLKAREEERKDKEALKTRKENEGEALNSVIEKYQEEMTTMRMEKATLEEKKKSLEESLAAFYAEQ